MVQAEPLMYSALAVAPVVVLTLMVRAINVLGACTGACSALKLLGPGTVDLGFDFWITAACAGGAGGGVFGRVTCGIGGGTTFEGPATGRCGGVAEAVPLLSFWFSRKTARALRCSSTKLKLSMIPLLAANLYAVQHSNKNRGTSNSALNDSSLPALKIFVFSSF